MTNRDKLIKLKSIKNNLLRGTIYRAIVEFENIFAVTDNVILKNEFENIKATINFMLEYFGKDTPDDQRENIYRKIRLDLITLTDKTKEYIKSYQVTDFQNIYSYYYQKIDVKKLLFNFENDQSDLDSIFRKLWLTDNFSTDLKSILNDFFDNDAIDNYYKSSIVSAITLSLIRFFDENKFETLFDIYHKQIGECSLRALVGVVLNILIHQKVIELHPKVISRFDLLNEIPNNSENTELILFQLIKSKETEEIIKEFEEHIMPEMMKMQSEIKDFNFEDLSSENMMDEENPGWENFFDKNPGFLERMENFTKRQFDGSDIFSATLGNLKNFAFFQKISNWFLPFSSNNQDIKERLQIALDEETTNKFLTTFEKASYFCNSDKYSFCLHVPDIAPPMRDAAVNMLMAEIDSAEEMLKEDHLNDFNRDSKDIIVRYIQDLYRFFNFNTKFKGFKNIFKLDLSIHNSRALQYFDNQDKILRSTAELLFSKKFFAEAVQAFEKSIELGANEADVYEKAAFSFQKIKQFEKALEYYKRAELFDQNKKWLFQKIGFTSLKTNNFQQALDYYLKAETLDPENITIQTFVGRSYVELENHEEALKYFFKADFYKPNSPKIMRSIVYSSFKLNKLDQAIKYANKCIEIDGQKFDFFILGDIYWIKNNIKEAIQFYVTAMNEFENFTDFLNEFKLSKDTLLENNISEINYHLMIDFLEMTYYKS